MKTNKYLSVFVLSWLLTNCVEPKKIAAPEVAATVMHGGYLTNNSNPEFQAFATKLAKSRDRKIHIFQLGDSHTAADLMSGPLREYFQQKYGDGGAGFISPTGVPGNRYSAIRFSRANGWSLFTSRKTSEQNFSLGGNIAKPGHAQNQAGFTVSDGQSPIRLQALYRSQGASSLRLQHVEHPLQDTQGRWAFSPSWNVTSPVNFSLSTQGEPALAGWMLTHPGGGVILSAAGINGAQISILNKWQANWQQTLAQLQPDMVILAYGTNEAFNNDLDIGAYRALLTEQVRMLRNQLPDSVILLVGPGSSVMNKQATQCQSREPAKLTAVIATQRDVAQQEKLLFWDWYAFMGGACGIDNWQARGLARQDRVHLTSEGYKASADALWQDLDAAISAAAQR